MDVYWDGLNRHLHSCDPAKVLDWCRREQLEYSIPAALVHYMVCWRELTHTGSDWVPEGNRRVPDKYQRMLLPKPSDPVERWRELLEWRHPRMDLNLLQLALIFDAPFCMNYLGQPIFMRAEGYRDEKSVLVNHPFHMACRLNWPWILCMTGWSLPDDVFCEEGIVDLRQGRIQRLPSPENQEIPNAVDPSANRSPTSSTGNVSVGNENELLALIQRNNVTVKQISLGLTPTVGTCFSLIAKDNYTCVTLLFMHALNNLSIENRQSQSSTVGCLMKTVGNLCRRGMTVECYESLTSNFMVFVYSEYRSIFRLSWQFPDTSEEETLGSATLCTEVTLLVCQLSACVAEGTGSWAESLEALCYLFMDMIDIAGVESVQRAASYLPRKHLPSIIRILQERRQSNRVYSNSSRDPQLTSALNMFNDMAEETNLENLCVLKILESVRGDARAARSLSVLPEPLRELFHVPFQDLYDQLTAGNQA